MGFDVDPLTFSSSGLLSTALCVQLDGVIGSDRMREATSKKPLPAWEEILLRLKKFYSNKRPYSLEADQEFLSLQMGPNQVTKFTVGHFIACQVAYDENSFLKWMQTGDNTSDVLVLYGSDPATSAKLDLAPRDICAPLDLIAVFRAYEPEDYWLYVTFGLSNLYATQPHPESQEYSGYGFELTMRVPCNEDDFEFPVWPQSFLQQYSQYVVRENCVFEAGQFVDAGGPIFPDTPTNIEGFVLAPDVQLGGGIQTASGCVEMLQLVGVTRDELDFACSIGINAFVSGLSRIEPMLITDYSRDSYLGDEFARAFHKPALEAVDEFIDKGDWPRAKDAASALLSVMSDSDGPLYFESLLALARVHAGSENYEEAEPLYKEALRVVTQARGEQDALAGNLYFALGNMYIKKDDYNNAESSFLMAKKILVAAAPEQLIDLADISSYLGMMHLSAGRNAEAEEELSEALRLFDDMGEIDADVVENLVLALERQGKDAEAAAVKAKYAT